MTVNGILFVRGMWALVRGVSGRGAAAAGVAVCVLACFGVAAAQLSASSAGGLRASSLERPLASLPRQPSAAGEPAKPQLPDQAEVGDPNENPAYYRAGPFLDGYHFNELPLDPDSPFYPSSATTRSGGYYSAAKLLDVERCGDAGCHPDIYDQWYESTHHLASFNDPWYRRSFQFFEERSGRQPSQWCAGCHDPAVMMTGVLAQGEPLDFDAPGSNIGISCQFCHSVGRIDPAHANASYELAPSAPLPEEGASDPERRRAGNEQLLADADLIRRHASDRRRPFLVLGEFCGTCHKQSLITPVNNYKWLRGFDEFDGWQNSGAAGYSARSFYYPERPRTCQNCHMPEVSSDDAGNDGGLVNSHRFLGANTALAAFHGYDRQLRETADFLTSDVVSVDLFAINPLADTSEALHGPLGVVTPSVFRGRAAELEVVVRTRGVGHMFPGGTIDSNMVWLELALLDETGKALLMSGGMAEDGFVDPDAHAYRGLFLDEAGQEITKRNGWDRRAAVYVRVIPPGAADTVHYRFVVPEDAPDTLRLRARLNYRKHKQAYNRWALGAEPAPEQPADAVSLPNVDTRRWVYDDTRVMALPTVVMAQDEVSLQVHDAVLESDSPFIVGPESRERINDYGIGLLRQGDLRGAVDAFRRVQSGDAAGLPEDGAPSPSHADPYINEARAHVQEGDLDAADAALQRAFEIEPDSFTAAYFMAQVAAGRGEFDRAAELLERVKRDFPYDRQVRIDLARVHYLEGRYQMAVEEALAALDIDPEELGAHYTLTLAYRALGEADKAAIHDARYRRYKEDEDIQALTGPFRRNDAAANREAQMIHVHDLAPPDGRFSAGDRYPVEAFLGNGPYSRPPTVFPGPTAPWFRDER